MPTVDINDLTSIGVIRDTPPYMLPPEAWNIGLNVRCVAEGIEALRGWEAVFGTPGVPPHFAMPLRTAAENFWIYASLDQIWVYDGTTHTNLTRLAGGPYSTSSTAEWSGTLLGGIPILCNEVDVPQYWASADVTVAMANLPNWPANLRGKTVRSLGPYLMAAGLTDAGGALPHTLQWSHPADPGSIPTSWDYTDPTVDAGRKDLPDVNAGIILDQLPLQSAMYVYKEGSVWRVTSIGGRFIFDFKTIFETVGALAKRCMAVTPDGTKQCFASQDDILWHNGNDSGSLLERSMKRRIFSEMDTVNYRNSFMFANPLYNEMWFCYPTSGHQQPNKAVIINMTNFPNVVVTEADGITFRNAAIGQIETPTSGIWSDPGTWDTDTEPWATVSRRKVLLCDPDAVKLYQMDSPQQTRNGQPYTVTLRREGLSIIGRKRSGDWIEDHQQLKLPKRVWPKLAGDPVKIRVGTQQFVGRDEDANPITWGPYVDFDPDSQVVCDTFAPDDGSEAGRTQCIEFQTTASNFWRLDGYKLEFDVLGEF